ncbi:bifunctional adenosylcobinamide kinase/adenosylcobinamide-phosphate guanylyltransferase [Variovorax sp. J31P179]|uniref:bifunctional adenosylcobinamide kinase/adenosylcobinamide-phosphate guanylyltransferase n=1 Tax=Variovorax sp. J31P179 TaxID=3053508 RepID=UPI0025766285|nr:bifunctional adenosylcobinamide kinase/adenosylcobinamide-phosphate guanylyltransferase [Variovorax sp. J31P179]MDM0080055.1 bifunctional adenosylcobinamide kinase/adenosylcobinamide-phosphate guanylyltransferase [Variovorax sp. J31P179]
MAAEAVSIARRELILGGQKSGKSRRGEQIAAAWLARSPSHRAVLVATARALDEEMLARVTRHREDRAARLPAMETVEEPLALAQAIRENAGPRTLVLVDCLTLWLTNLMVPFGAPRTSMAADRAVAELLQAIGESPGPLVLVGNEIGLGVIPLGREVRAFVDALGLLNQQVAAACERVTLMAAGLPLTLKDAP